MLDGAGSLLGVTVARMNDVAVLVVAASVPQRVNFGIKGDVAASFLRVNGVEPKTECRHRAARPATDRGGRQGAHGAGDVCAGGWGGVRSV